MTGGLEALDAITNTVLAYRPPRKVRSANGGLSTIELCSGGGGAALGLEQAGFSHVALIDNDPHSCATLRGNRPYWNVIEADIRRFDSAYWEGVDLVSGGLPCPPFSIAGKQLGADDDRDMFPSMLRIVKASRPRAVMIENVRGILHHASTSSAPRSTKSLILRDSTLIGPRSTRRNLAFRKRASAHF